MRATPMKEKERPNFDLMKQSDIQSVYHMQMPRWLFSDVRYMDMSLDAKIAYTFLLNRFQLSRRNGWINQQGEVFVIFPRKALAAELRICEQRVTAAFRMLTALKLIWEKLYSGLDHTTIVKDSGVISDIISLIETVTKVPAAGTRVPIESDSTVHLDPDQLETNARGWIVGMDNRRINIIADNSAAISVDGITLEEMGDYLYSPQGDNLGVVWQIGSSGRKMYVLQDGLYEIVASGKVRIEYANSGYYDKIVEYESESLVYYQIADHDTKDIDAVPIETYQENNPDAAATVPVSMREYSEEELQVLNQD